MRNLVIICLLLLPDLPYAQKKERWIAPGASLVIGHTNNLGVNLRTHYIPNERMCIRFETNLFPEEGALVEREFTLNAHLFFEVEEVVSVYPLLGVGYEEIKEEFERFSYKLDVKDVHFIPISALVHVYSV